MQLRLVTLRHVTLTLCCATLCSNIGTGVKGGMTPTLKLAVTPVQDSATGVLLFPLETERWNKGLCWFSIAPIGGIHISRMSPPVIFVLLYGCIFQLSVRGGEESFSYPQWLLPAFAAVIVREGRGQALYIQSFCFPALTRPLWVRFREVSYCGTYSTLLFLSPSGPNWKPNRFI